VPANEPSALSVGAIDKQGKIAEFSSRGPTAQGLIKPDVVAPGVSTTSSSTGLIALMQMGRDFPGTASISGTSMATPHTAGLCALALQYARSKGKNLTTDHIKEAMDLWGDYPGGAKNSDYGWGLISYPLLKRYVDEKLS
jgi:subtilisin family serine protease